MLDFPKPKPLIPHSKPPTPNVEHVPFLQNLATIVLLLPVPLFIED